MITGRWAGGDAADGLGHGLGQAPRDRWPASLRVGVCGPSGTTLDHVARQLDVARPPVADHGGQHAVDLAQGRVRIVQLGLGAADAAEDLGLRVKVLHAVVQAADC